MKIKTLEEAFVHGLSDIYSAEKQITKALPKLAKAATNQDLIDGFKLHLEQTKGQIERLDKVVELTGVKLKRIICEAMKGLVEEGNETIEEIEAGPVRDVMLIVGAQKVEHYEIATYGSLIELAKALGHKDAAAVLGETLDEEKATDKIMTTLAKSRVNKEALQAA